MNPYLVYPQTKHMSEMILRSFYELHGYPSTSFRFFNVFGEQQGKSRAQPPLVNYLHRELEKRNTPVIYAHHNQARECVYVDEVVEAIIRTVTKPARTYEIFNGGSGELISVQYILSSVAKGLGISQISLQQIKTVKMWVGFEELLQSSWPLKRGVLSREIPSSSKALLQKVNSEPGWKPQALVLEAIESYAKRLSVAEQK